jgi:hypothetical protein
MTLRRFFLISRAATFALLLATAGATSITVAQTADSASLLHLTAATDGGELSAPRIPAVDAARGA